LFGSFSLFDFNVLIFSTAKRLGLFRPAHHTEEANEGDNNSCDEHPDGFVSGRSSKEPGNVGAERIRGLNAEDHEHDSANEQNN
jgi:hypothetical protein